MKNKSKQNENLKRIILLCHAENLNRCKKLVEDSAFLSSLIKLAGHKEKTGPLELKIGVVSDSNINDK